MQSEIHSTPSSAYSAKQVLKLYCSTWVFNFPCETRSYWIQKR